MSGILGCATDGPCYVVQLNEHAFACYAADSIDAIRLARAAAGMPISTIKPDARLATPEEVALFEATQEACQEIVSLLSPDPNELAKVDGVLLGASYESGAKYDEAVIASDVVRLEGAIASDESFGVADGISMDGGQPTRVA